MPTYYNFSENGNVYSFDDVFVRRDVLADGQVFTWGSSSFGQTADWTTAFSRSTPKQEFTSNINWLKLPSNSSSQSSSMLAIKSDGTLWSWGRNNYGQLGDNTLADRSTPRQEFTSSTNWVQVSAGAHSAAIKSDGSLWCWGLNSYGQLGDNTAGNTAYKSTPRQISAGANGITGWKQVDCGGFHTIALRNDGTLWAWGRNSQGQVGDNTTITRSSPRQISAGATGITGWKQISGGTFFSAAIRTNNTLWVWGDNFYGNLGDNTNISKSLPVQEFTAGTNWKQVSCNNWTTTAIKNDGTLWSWGLNSYGQLGDNSTITKSSPRQEFTASNNWKQVSAGDNHILALKSNGTLWGWGQNTNGQVGDNTSGTNANRSTPRQEFTASNNWKQVCASNQTTVAIKYI